MQGKYGNKCVLKRYCVQREKAGVCARCKEYSKFERIQETHLQKMGRRNKLAGRNSEKKTLKHFMQAGIPSRIVAGSGKYKRYNEGMEGDLRVEILGKERLVENKKRQSFRKLRAQVGEKRIIYIEGFCYAMDEFVFYACLKGVKSWHDESTLKVDGYFFPLRSIPDRGLNWLHGFFNQDGAEIVTLDESYKSLIVCVDEKLFDSILRGENQS